MIKLFLGTMLGISFYGFLCYYQPITESQASSQVGALMQEEEAAVSQQQYQDYNATYYSYSDR